MINKNIFQFPINYTSIIGQIAIGWGVHETVAYENDFAREGNPHDFNFDEVVALFNSLL
jgi:hypothetical protein